MSMLGFPSAACFSAVSCAGAAPEGELVPTFDRSHPARERGRGLPQRRTQPEFFPFLKPLYKTLISLA